MKHSSETNEMLAYLRTAVASKSSNFTASSSVKSLNSNCTIVYTLDGDLLSTLNDSGKLASLVNSVIETADYYAKPFYIQAVLATINETKTHSTLELQLNLQH